MDLPWFADHTVTGGKLKIHVAGQEFTQGDPGVLEKVKAAISQEAETGQYEGRSLEFGKGGRSALFFDRLLAEGHTPEDAVQIVKTNAALKGIATARAAKLGGVL